MGRTLMVGDRQHSWREWARTNAAGRDHLVLDPACADYGPPSRLLLVRDGKVAAWAHVGSVDPLRDPVSLVSGAARLLRMSGNGAVVQLFPWRESPLGRHVALALGQLVAPDRVLVPSGTGLESEPWPVGAEVVSLPESFPQMVQEAQRRAQWIDLMENAEPHKLDLSHVKVTGARFGSGSGLDQDRAGCYAESSGGVLLMVTDHPMGDAEVGRAMDLVGANRSQIVAPSNYAGLVCSFANQDGEDFGLGIVQSIDFDRLVAEVHALAVAPSPVRILKLGTLRVDGVGKEIEDLKPWAV